ncbi:hypothetical protein RO3G_01420 [Rhizopus delemar RA 99-880]|uniref:Uncharacterized protein n=1 Tax=Rhizopus delemar (strain RA 99-880 / ATCC MYA-4621 / FGSC 9543 / NRRL 43880) TaxID=246409 RepID=I1BKI6_RHIO9|nr:hypothetical protein RO3G_01420 [Rhizopus delemar RA 99-880]|eukprot:EIE76716.1 hypothetical protein RO3G_01420 [Rhizopus delemar RA 99-880]
MSHIIDTGNNKTISATSNLSCVTTKKSLETPTNRSESLAIIKKMKTTDTFMICLSIAPSSSATSTAPPSSSLESVQ